MKSMRQVIARAGKKIILGFQRLTKGLIAFAKVVLFVIFPFVVGLSRIVDVLLQVGEWMRA